MKKIFLFLTAICLFIACDPVHEDIKMQGNISPEELLKMVNVRMDKAQSGKNGNVILCTCDTKAGVTVGWRIDDKNFAGYDVSRKVKLGEHTVTLTAVCGDGTKIVKEFTLNAEEITDPLTKYYIFGDPKDAVAPLVMNQGDAGAGRFSDNEGKGLPYLADGVYWGFKTLIFDLEAEGSDAGIWGEPAGPAMVRIMNGWWAATYADEVEIPNGKQLWELQLTKEIAADCASKKSGGEGKDLDILVRRGKLTVNSVYYEE